MPDEAANQALHVRSPQEPAMSDLGELRDGLRRFVDERNWGSFHDPKSVLLALVGEVGELAELLQWLPADEVRALAAEPALHRRLGEEMSDVLLYLVLLADVLAVDLPAAARAKLADAHRRYPVGAVPERQRTNRAT